MACAVARLWEDEVGGRPVQQTTIGPEVPMSRKRKGRSKTPSERDEERKRRKSGSPFRPWTPQPSPQEEPLALVSEPKRQSDSPGSPDSRSVSGEARTSSENGSSQRRNYKNMSRERRIEANARERTRVHTISAAFDSLRRAVPAYSHNQKLSKLSVLRIAASYILTLSRVLGEDYSADQSQPSIEECIDNVSNTIQSEGKVKKK